MVYGNKEGLVNLSQKSTSTKSNTDYLPLLTVQDETLEQMILDNQMVFLYSIADVDKRRLLEYCYQHDKVTFITPELSDIITKHSIHTLVDDVTVLESRVTGLTFEQSVVKRACDILVSGIGLIIASPVMLLEALAIKLEDGGPVFFKQPRVTKDGKAFNVLKFRTMIVDADKIKSGSPQKAMTALPKSARCSASFGLMSYRNFKYSKGRNEHRRPRPEQVEITEKYVEILPEFKYRLKVKSGANWSRTDPRKI